LDRESIILIISLQKNVIFVGINGEQKKGLPVNVDATTIDEATEQICKALGKK